jgi:hypothetical protein
MTTKASIVSLCVSYEILKRARVRIAKACGIVPATMPSPLGYDRPAINEMAGLRYLL